MIDLNMLNIDKIVLTLEIYFKKKKLNDIHKKFGKFVHNKKISSCKVE